MSSEMTTAVVSKPVSASLKGPPRRMCLASSLILPKNPFSFLALPWMSFFLLLNTPILAVPTVSLESLAEQELRLRWSDGGHVTRVFGTLRSTVTKDELLATPYSSSDQFLRLHAKDFGITDRITFEQSKTGNRRNGGLYVRLKQHHLELPIENASAVIAYDQYGNIDYAIVEIDRNVDIYSTTPLIDEPTARSLAVHHFRATNPTSSPNVSVTDLKLVIVSSEFHRDITDDKLAWKMVAFVSNSTSLRNATIFLDALNGDILRKVDRVRHGSINRSVHDATGVDDPSQVDWSDEAAIVSESNPPSPSTIDVQAWNVFGLSKETYDFYSALGWDGYDSEDATVYSGVHYESDALCPDADFGCETDDTESQGGLVAPDTELAETIVAAWIPGNGVSGEDDYYPDHMAFSDGMEVKDVVTHEYTHGVIQYSSELEYSGVTGAIHESVADVMAVLHERTNWTIAEDSTLGTIRDIQNPGSLISPLTGLPYPSHVQDYHCTEEPHAASNDYGGIHVNSSILNHLAYKVITLTTKRPWSREGGSGPTPGNVTAGKLLEKPGILPISERYDFDGMSAIYYEIATVCLTSNSDFTDFRDCLLEQADSYYDGEDYFFVSNPVTIPLPPSPQPSFRERVELALQAVGIEIEEDVELPCD